ncbi:AAA family ATPase [Romboutsia hominis]|uniref:P-loop containing nucleoside triphosphate hydrolase n=1 Tax=Romboutsia hominis TaxID=1507512 RepID=A0A2P2BQS9_9FIRM|nr:AAA family ATPase [Romboutsia hominis]CEI72720.1 P-loop containing nucleoside triphosphate hydrolase [Romboutsia hominis]
MINYIKLKNFKCFENEQIKLSKSTLLLGVNSGGKSSLIQSLLLFNSSIFNLQDKDISSLDLINNKYNLNLYSFDEILNNKYDDDFFEISIFNGNEETKIEYTPTDDNNIIDLNIDTNTNMEPLDIIYLGAERSITSFQRNGNINNIELGRNNEYIGYIIEKGKKRAVKAYEDRNHWTFKDTALFDFQVNKWLDYILPSNKVSASSIGIDNYISLTFGEKLNLHQTNIGYGVSFILPIIVGGLIAKPESILIVENPELHLHPSAQSKIAEFLGLISMAGVQVIVETHSEHVVNGFRKSVLNKEHPLQNVDLVINYFDNDGSCEIKRIELNERAEIKYWPKGFMDQEEKDLFEMRKMRLGIQ